MFQLCRLCCRVIQDLYGVSQICIFSVLITDQSRKTTLSELKGENIWMTRLMIHNVHW